MNKFLKLAVSILFCEAVGVAGVLFTISAIPTWYTNLNKSSFSPPNWIFGPVWTILYALMGVAAYLVWEKGPKNRKVRIALIFFAIQLLLNFLWPVLFFGLRSPILAFIEIILLLTVIIATTMKLYYISRLSAYLMLPYLVWVTFATLLNLSIVILNP